MRKGQNISKDKLLKLIPCDHRVIIPLYIPHENDYYKDSFKIFEICLKSIIKTARSPLKISVISDSCCHAVNKKLFALQNSGLIDELVIETENLGKINCILKALRTVQERLITITDADVLFLNNWEQAVLDVFEAFPKAGVVCPVPVFRTHFRLTSNIWMRYLFSSKLKFLPVKNQEAMTRFANSIGWPWLDDKWKDTIGTLKAKNDRIAVLGSSHFVATYKKEVFTELPKENSKFKLGGDSEYLYTDKPILKVGGYRLSTYDNFAYHMGNCPEDWMLEKYNNLKEETKSFKSYQYLNTLKKSMVNYWFAEKVFKKILSIKIIKSLLLKQKGLRKEQVKNFLE